MADVQPGKLAVQARKVVSELTGYKPETVTGLSRNGDGWVVTVEVLELERVPNTMDVLGTYEVTLNDEGQIVGIRRRRRYHRAAIEHDEE